MSLLLSQQYSTWQEVGFLLAFLAIVGLAAAIGRGVKPPKVLALLRRTMHSSTQLPVRISLLLLAGLFSLAAESGLRAFLVHLLQAWSWGLVTRGDEGKVSA